MMHVYPTTPLQQDIVEEIHTLNAEMATMRKIIAACKAANEQLPPSFWQYVEARWVAIGPRIEELSQLNTIAGKELNMAAEKLFPNGMEIVIENGVRKVTTNHGRNQTGRQGSEQGEEPSGNPPV